MTYILPADNAVIDYSIMSQIINAINTLDDQVQKLVSNQSSSSGSGNGGVTALSTVKGDKVAVASTATSATVTISGITNIQSVVGILYLPSSKTPIACSINGFSGNKATFVFTAPKMAATLYWIAFGTN
jgi:hypothetical protein